ncbi:hypothetical protein ZMTM_04150 [Methyloradius palustris]|uniref:NERD domain-containing protein n=2 Tax=Methyloradius palustris TaxID=2778876 RepID=A0A8D5G6G3_9PROT|nr:hypothetical protein ZMTM_04150 [Methyloradius palustris]
MIAIVYGLVFFKKRNVAKRRNPITRDLLRSPGESLRIELDDVSVDLMLNMAVTPLIPLILYSGYLSNVVFGNIKWGDLFSIVFYTLVGLGATLYSGRKMYQLANKKNKLSLGLDAELAVAQELNLLAHHSYWVFHDIPAEGFNIDHVLVGPSGIYAIETKGRAKPIMKDGKADWNVNYDGKTLNFPGWQETKPIEQAQRQAKWLQQYLSGAVGESVSVIPGLALPGWFIKRTGRNGITVFNGKNAAQILFKTNSNLLPDKLIKQIAHQLDHRCRTVKPLALSPTAKQ